MTEITARLSTALAAVALAISACQGGGSQNAETLRRSCDDGDAAACYNLGVLYYNGEGVTQDPARAATLVQQACDGGIVQGCYNAAQAFHAGLGVPPDLLRAAGLYEQACDGGIAQSCYNLGWLYRNGAGVLQDLTRGRQPLPTSLQRWNRAGL